MTQPMKYSVEIEVEKNADVVFSYLTDLSKWWPEDFKGEPIRKNSEFVFSTGDGHYSTNRVTEFVPGKRVVWQATNSLRRSDGFDWSGSKFIFDLVPSGSSTVVRFTYDGVVLAHESEKLIRICDLTLKEMFFNYVVKGKGK